MVSPTAFLIFALRFGAFRSVTEALPVLAIVPFTLVGAAAGPGLLPAALSHGSVRKPGARSPS